MGVENIFKRITQCYDVELPQSDRWHVKRFLWFGPSSHELLPVLLTEELAMELRQYRQYRHVGYHFELDWYRMEEGIQRALEVYERFRRQIQA